MSPNPQETELRICLVLYGGVSLAIYENGVTRTLYDLVKRNGGFAVLLDLLEMRAIVDVIAGTSAGGINGLMLAAALEHGTSFEQTANLWRDHGDLGKLLRADAKNAPSLLDSEGYYQQRLYEAFLGLSSNESKTDSSPSAWGHEIDVLITGTDLDGSILKHQDALGNVIEDKTHRVVFHLKHRPERQWLGLPGARSELTSEEDKKLQAAVLASVSRITSTFPVAFAPFEVSQVELLEKTKDPRQLPPGLGKQVGPILDRLGDIEGEKHLVDGGVLDNKPFKPALNAVFYRMPKGRVQRRLYYLEPDPTEYSSVEEESAHTPARVALAALMSIPGYEGISEDLESIRHHNAQVRWMKTLRNQTLSELSNGTAEGAISRGSLQWRIYCRARAASLAKSMLLKWYRVPSARDYPSTPESKELVKKVEDYLVENARADIPPYTGLEAWDVEFQLRRCFFLLYHHYESIFPIKQKDSGKPNESKKTPRSQHLVALQAIGRLVKFLEVIRTSLLQYRDNYVLGQEMKFDTPERVLLPFTWLMDQKDSAWSGIATDLQNAIAGDPYAIADEAHGPLSKRHLTQAHSNVIARLNSDAYKDLEKKDEAADDSVLSIVQEAAKAIISGLYPEDSVFENFALIDLYGFPAEYSTGIHELDELDYIRISPKDARTGLSGEVSEQNKVCGDALAHFSAFLRKDWRSNDILWGQIDGISQIVADLLQDNVLEDLASRHQVVPQCLQASSLRDAMPDCPQDKLEELVRAAESTFGPNQALSSDFDRLREAFASALQFDTVAREAATVFRDVHTQDIDWDLASLQGVKSISSKGIQELMVDQETERIIKSLPPEDRWARFKSLGLGAERVAGKEGRVPLNILGEYLSRGYELIWSLVDQSLKAVGTTRDSVLSHTRVKNVGLRPIQALRVMLSLSRTEHTIAPLIFVSILSLTLTGALLAAHQGKTLAAFLFFVAFVGMSSVVTLLTPGIPWKRRIGRILSISVISILILAALVAISAFLPEPGQSPVTALAEGVDEARASEVWVVAELIVILALLVFCGLLLLRLRLDRKPTSDTLAEIPEPNDSEN